MTDFSQLVPISSIPNLNKNLSSAREGTMNDVLGAPRQPLTRECHNDHVSPTVRRLIDTKPISPHMGATGVKPAVESLQAIMAKVAVEHADLIDVLRSSGTLCVRLRKPTSGAASTHASNHSWGTAIDLHVEGHSPPADTGHNVPRFIAILVPFFNEAGWFSGIGFRDDMHFEVADETIRKWHDEGRFAVAAAA
jgi:hypothetical protein